MPINGSNRLSSNAAGTITIAGNLLGNVQNPVLYTPQSTLILNGSGTAASPQLLEVMGRDIGLDPSGFTHNFAYGTLALANNTYVQLVDQSPNTASGAPEAIYVNSLIVPSGTTLDLNGLHLYARAVQNDGTIRGGKVNQVPIVARSRLIRLHLVQSIRRANSMSGLSSGDPAGR